MKRVLVCLLSFILLSGMLAPAAFAEEVRPEQDFMEGLEIVYLGADAFAQSAETIGNYIADLESSSYRTDVVEGSTWTGDADSYVSRMEGITNEDKCLWLARWIMSLLTLMKKG